MHRALALVVLLAAPVAFAGDDAPKPAASGDLQKLLNSIPDIQTAPTPPPADQKPAEDESMDLPQYTSMVREAIYAHWQPDTKLVAKNPNLGAQLLVKVNEDGSLQAPVAIKLSGNKKFDKSIVDAVFSTPSVKAPGPGMRGTVADGIIVTFVASAAPNAPKS